MKPKRMTTRGVVALLLAALTIAGAALAQMRRPDPSSMSPYVLGIYVRGPKWTAERTPYTDSIQAGHLANMQVMAEAGALLGAGPFAGNRRERGLLIFRDLPMDSVMNMVRRDPAIKAERLMIDLHRWYAPRGIGEAYMARAAARPDKPDSMIRVPMAMLNRPAKPASADSATAARAMRGHAGHILDLLTSGKALAAGPVFDNGPLRGVTFFATDSATAHQLAHDDPSVKAGLIEISMYQAWIGWGVLPPKPTIREMGKP